MSAELCPDRARAEVRRAVDVHVEARRIGVDVIGPAQTINAAPELERSREGAGKQRNHDAGWHARNPVVDVRCDDRQ